jgi:glutaredoxin 3
MRQQFHEKEGELKGVREAIEASPVVIFSKSNCPYCMKAKDLFKSLGVKFQAVELDEEKTGPEIQHLLTQVTRVSTVPSVWVKGQFLGGCDDVHNLHRQGKLQELLKE